MSARQANKGHTSEQAGLTSIGSTELAFRFICYSF